MIFLDTPGKRLSQSLLSVANVIMYNTHQEFIMDKALLVPAIYERVRIPQTVIDELARQIAEKFQPQRIILFGSYAWGNPSPESDVDLLVVMETPHREAEQALQIYQQLDYLFGLDLLVITPERLTERLNWGDSFLRDILKRGKVLYESSNPRMG